MDHADLIHGFHELYSANAEYLKKQSTESPRDLQEQLGLKLDSAKEAVSVLVIDSVNQPSPN